MNKIRGFTLVELMVTIAVAAILLTVGVPSFRELIQNNRVTTSNNALITALQLARSEAVKRGRSITVCASTDGTSCAASVDWTTGWIVTTDPADATAVIRAWDSLGSGLTLTGDDDEVVYRASGSTAAAVNFTLDFNACTGTRARAIAVSTTGRPNSSAAACS